MNNDIFANVDEYIIDLFAKEDDLLKTIQGQNDSLGIPQINISPSQGKLLQVLAKVTSAKNILEVGTLAGYSTIWLARALGSSGKVVTLEVDAGYAEVAKSNFQKADVSDKIEIHIGQALDSLQRIADEGCPEFDMVFIDADKPPYLEYFNWAVKLCRKGAIIVADNVVRQGKVLDENSDDAAVKGVRRLSDALSTDERVTTTILQTVGLKEHDGMLIAVVN